MGFLNFIGKSLARYLTKPSKSDIHLSTSRPELVAATLRKGDILLVEGNSRISVAIKYLTQSSWSHAALYIGDTLKNSSVDPHVLIEADVTEGVRTVPLSHYSTFHTRICRPVGLSPVEIDRIIMNALSQLGHRYDLKNIFDLARYLFPRPPVPNRFRRRMIALGSGDPTKAICSSMIAKAFQSVNYPILPEIYLQPAASATEAALEVLHIRHHSLYAPRDFDISPYFAIIKPTLAHGFDFHKLTWSNDTIESETPLLSEH